MRIANDGLPNDGRIGLDSDNIGTDVTVLTGSRFADELTGVGASLCCADLHGGPGDDVMRSTGDNQVNFRMGSVADGADKIIGGRVDSVVDYSKRTRPVTATLNFGGADDGEAGERDEIIGGHELLFGGQAGDILRAPFGSRASHLIEGNGGGDTIDGADGADRLTGGSGGDSVRAFGGDDQVFARDGVVDTVDCGFETDTVGVDPIDNFGSCENGTIGVLRLAPKAQRVKAGGVARLRLSWRHPRSWRQLRRIELRLYHRARQVGRVTIHPRGKRIDARGTLVLLPRASQLSHKGKTVSPRLVLRLDRSLAARRLRLEVKAIDIRGARQLERKAGSLRVTR